MVLSAVDAPGSPTRGRESTTGHGAGALFRVADTQARPSVLYLSSVLFLSFRRSHVPCPGPGFSPRDVCVNVTPSPLHGTSSAPRPPLFWGTWGRSPFPAPSVAVRGSCAHSGQPSPRSGCWVLQPSPVLYPGVSLRPHRWRDAGHPVPDPLGSACGCFPRAPPPREVLTLTAGAGSPRSVPLPASSRPSHRPLGLGSG